MLIDFKYVYLALASSIIFVWLLFFILSKGTRKEQIIMSLLFLPTGTIFEMRYFEDYWIPGSVASFNLGPIRVLLEDFLYSFALTGIGTVIYHAILRVVKKAIAIFKITGLLDLSYDSIFMGNKSLEPRNFLNGLLRFILVFAIVILLYFLVPRRINSIFAASSIFFMVALFIISRRRDLLLNSLLTGFGVMAVMFIGYFIGQLVVLNYDDILHQLWKFYHTPLDRRVLNVPATEMIWGFAYGLFVGPLYSFCWTLIKPRLVDGYIRKEHSHDGK